MLQTSPSLPLLIIACLSVKIMINREFFVRSLLDLSSECGIKYDVQPAKFSSYFLFKDNFNWNSSCCLDIQQVLFETTPRVFGKCRSESRNTRSLFSKNQVTSKCPSHGTAVSILSRTPVEIST